VHAGGVNVSYFEWVQGLQSYLWTEMEVTDKLFRILEHSFAQVIRRAKAHKISHRTAAMAMASSASSSQKLKRCALISRSHCS
jgi:glutamate dehydrogenase (NAD(P)+)